MPSGQRYLGRFLDGPWDAFGSEHFGHFWGSKWLWDGDTGDASLMKHNSCHCHELCTVTQTTSPDIPRTGSNIPQLIPKQGQHRYTCGGGSHGDSNRHIHISQQASWMKERSSNKHRPHSDPTASCCSLYILLL